MGRSVSYASGATAICYKDVSRFGYTPGFDDNGDEINGDDESKWTFDEFAGQVDWDNWISELKEDARKAFPSMDDCDKWIGREDHAILANRYAYIGVSEYCGLASIWLVERGDLETDQDIARARHWLGQVKPKFEKLFGDLRRLGTFSNGEGVYERKAS